MVAGKSALGRPKVCNATVMEASEEDAGESGETFAGRTPTGAISAATRARARSDETTARTPPPSLRKSNFRGVPSGSAEPRTTAGECTPGQVKWLWVMKAELCRCRPDWRVAVTARKHGMMLR